MYQVVLDTNVVVAAVLSNRGASHRLMRLLGDPRFEINLSVPLALEYEQVLLRVREKTQLSPADVDVFLDYLCSVANLRPVFFLWRPALVDPDDEMVLELAVESRSEFIVTFNLADFSAASQFGIEVVPPAAFLARIGERP